MVLGGEKKEEVKEFKYLGTMLWRDGCERQVCGVS